MSLQNVRRGDQVLVVTQGWRRSEPTRVEWLGVIAAGPKYITAGRERYYRDTGDHVSDYSTRSRAYASEADYDACKAREALVGKASRLLTSCSALSYSNDQLTALIEILEAK